MLEAAANIFSSERLGVGTRHADSMYKNGGFLAFVY